MSIYEILGWLGNACFFSRSLVQWWQSERAGESVAPHSFWWLSIAGALALGAYSVAAGEPVLLAGYAMTTCIYARNLWFSLRPRRRATHPLWIAALAVVGALLLFSIEGIHLRGGFGAAPGWLAVGVVGQAVWSTRFLVQWALSERHGTSHFPRAFWWASLVGNALLLAYALHLRDAVFIAGFALGPIVQVRNLMLGGGGETARAEG